MDSRPPSCCTSTGSIRCGPTCESVPRSKRLQKSGVAQLGSALALGAVERGRFVQKRQRSQHFDIYCSIQVFSTTSQLFEYLNMAKATITTPQGIQVKVDGSPAEITAVIHDLERKSAATPSGGRPRKTRPGRASIPDLIESMGCGYFGTTDNRRRISELSRLRWLSRQTWSRVMGITPAQVPGPSYLDWASLAWISSTA